MDSKIVEAKESARVSPTLWSVLNQANVITLIGAGGKTSGLCRLVSEASTAKHIVATTTTKVFPLDFPGKWLNSLEPPPMVIKYPCFWYAGLEETSGKWFGPPKKLLESIICRENNESRLWIIEGDGARRRKLKCWAAHEPQIPVNTECVILMIDGTLWGRIPKPEEVHRLELCPFLTDREFDVFSAWRYLLASPVFNPMYARMEWLVMINYYQDMQGDNDFVFPDIIGELAEKAPEFLAPGITGEIKPACAPRLLRLAMGDIRKGEIRWLDLY